MNRGYRLIFIFWILISVALPIEVSALEYCGYQVTEIPVPEEYQLIVSSVCSIHQNFQSIATNQEGFAAIYSRNTKIDQPEQFDHIKYIDLFNADGDFVEEIQFSTSLPVEIELTEDTLMIYFHINILTYNLKERSFHYYALPSGVNLATDFLPAVRNKSLDVGSWSYSLEKELDGYKAVSRTNIVTGVEQTLMSCVGSKRTPLNTIVIPAVVSILILFWGINCRKNKKNPRFGR